MKRIRLWRGLVLAAGVALGALGNRLLSAPRIR